MFEMQASHPFYFIKNNNDNFINFLLNYCTKSEIEEIYNKKYSIRMADITHYELPNPYLELEEGEEFVQANKTKLIHACGASIPWMVAFEYDYGDGWGVDLTVERHEKREESLSNLPQILTL
jgi:hypothetical protein